MDFGRYAMYGYRMTIADQRGQVLSPVSDACSFQELAVTEGFERKRDSGPMLRIGVDARCASF